ncbi:hypothetical protein QYE76_070956 [Lolium multiflorum]|uniref:Uncharacterized protein n=1 Tax=Lolium multiflorum TaxID=4521 RepID=A0AAD8SJ60_LOLMU|nr:hypothetical protein QYE76_070956 [Lolium multiflorum]
MATSATSGATGSETGKDEMIDDMFSHLELNADELDDVMIGTVKAKKFKKESCWLAIAKVVTTRSFSAEALFEKMRIIWNLSRDLICRAAGENLVIFQMHCLGDWKKTVHQGRGAGRPNLGRKRSSDEVYMEDEGDLKDTTASPIKLGQRIEPMEDDSDGIRRRLQFDGDLVGDNSGSVQNAPGNEPPVPPLPP